MDMHMVEQNDRRIDGSGDMAAFFKDGVCAAWTKAGLREDQKVKQYLIGLLLHFSPAQEDEIRAKPLLHDLSSLSAIQDKAQHISSLRGIADAALVAAGLFEKFLARKIMGVRSYITVAECGYAALAHLVSRRDENTHTFRVFSRNAFPYALVLRSVWSHTVLANGDMEEIARVTKSYLLHENPEDKDWLEAHGITLFPKSHLDRLIII